MDIFYPEYALIAVCGVIAAWRIVKDTPDSEAYKRSKRPARKDSMAGDGRIKNNRKRRGEPILKVDDENRK